MEDKRGNQGGRHKQGTRGPEEEGMGKALSSVFTSGKDRNNHTFHITSTGAATLSPILSKGGQLRYDILGWISGMEWDQRTMHGCCKEYVLLSTPAGQGGGCHSLPGMFNICRWSAQKHWLCVGCERWGAFYFVPCCYVRNGNNRKSAWVSTSTLSHSFVALP